MAAETIRERIITSIIARLEMVRTVYGFTTEAGSQVFRERRRIDLIDAPCLNVWPGAEEASRLHQKQTCLMQFGVEAYALIGSADPSVVKGQLLGDMIQIMTDPAGRDALDPDGLTEDIEYTGGGTSAPVEAGDTTVGISTVFRIKYRQKLGNPYAQ